MISPQGQPSPDSADLQNRRLAQLAAKYLNWRDSSLEEALGEGTRLESFAQKDEIIAQRLAEMRSTYAEWASLVGKETLLHDKAVQSYLAAGILNGEALKAIIFRLQRQKYREDLMAFFRAVISDGLLDFYIQAKQDAREGEQTQGDEDFKRSLLLSALPLIQDVFCRYPLKSYIPFPDVAGRLDFVEGLLESVDFDLMLADRSTEDRQEARFVFEKVRDFLLDYMKKEKLGELVEVNVHLRFAAQSPLDAQALDTVGEDDPFKEFERMLTEQDSGSFLDFGDWQDHEEGDDKDLDLDDGEEEAA